MCSTAQFANAAANDAAAIWDVPRARHIEMRIHAALARFHQTGMRDVDADFGLLERHLREVPIAAANIQQRSRQRAEFQQDAMLDRANQGAECRQLAQMLPQNILGCLQIFVAHSTFQTLRED